ncbi:MAG: hypothetical protein HY959_08260 [Ignavibacteriae bacterium]|nr:hypothetical protein [Ignavibacteriota bacterium]
MKLWRFGQIKIKDGWEIFYKENILTFNWLKANINYKNIKNLKKINGWTCITPWVKELKKGDLIFLFSRNSYAGVAIAEESYKYNINDFKILGKERPGIKVKFLHKLKTPVEHGIEISHKNPKVFTRVGDLKFSSFMILNFIKKKYKDKYNIIIDYIKNNFNSESEKISRICWNTNRWRFPSGPEGKTKTKNTYESKYNYGHEEWLSNNTRPISGYNYGFLQTLNMISNRHIDKSYRIYLYTINDANERLLVGEIRNGWCISKAESVFVYNIYKRKKWIDEMVIDLNNYDINLKPFLKTSPKIFFNLKYKKEDIIIYEIPINIISFNKNISSSRYKLLDKITDFKIISTEASDNKGTSNDKSTKKVTRKLKGGKVTYDPVHNKIQNILHSYLESKGEYKKVKKEVDGVDVWAKTNQNKLHFYEVKTNNSKLSIRNALGQVLEYSCWPELNKAEKLIIVSDSEEDEETKKYMKHIRNKYNIPIFYMSYSFEKNKFGGLI